ncbi:transcriptional activator RfaH [Gymnodinialimonas sp. 57CJ19]|uniref:transcription termination/antitermination protein NusG n=1 Tax=Gymnodinialimonas sp. 57CJ19 TaxID=3138498 RepID=UPI0031344C9B
MGPNNIGMQVQWFLAQVKPNSASIAQRNLLRQGFETFLPLEEATQARNGSFVTTHRPVFPGYIFVAVNAAQGAWRAINSTQGITRLVSFGHDPATVPPDLIKALKARCGASGYLVSESEISSGDAVSFTTGPFVDFVGEVEETDSKRRVWVLLELLGGQARVAAKEGQLRTI